MDPKKLGRIRDLFLSVITFWKQDYLFFLFTSSSLTFSCYAPCEVAPQIQFYEIYLHGIYLPYRISSELFQLFQLEYRALTSSCTGIFSLQPQLVLAGWSWNWGRRPCSCKGTKGWSRGWKGDGWLGGGGGGGGLYSGLELEWLTGSEAGWEKGQILGMRVHKIASLQAWFFLSVRHITHVNDLGWHW